MRKKKKTLKKRMMRKKKKTMMRTNFSGNSSSNSSKLGGGSQMAVRPKANLFQPKSGRRTLRSRQLRNVGIKDGTDYLTSRVV